MANRLLYLGKSEEDQAITAHLDALASKGQNVNGWVKAVLFEAITQGDSGVAPRDKQEDKLDYLIALVEGLREREGLVARLEPEPKRQEAKSGGDNEADEIAALLKSAMAGF